MRLIVDLLERACVMFHFLNPLLIKLGLPHCPLALLSYRLDKKFNVGVWKSVRTN